MEEKPDIKMTQEEVSRPELKPYLERILTAIGHPEALITDESSIYDFGCFSDLMERQLIVDLRKHIGLTVGVHDTFWKIAERLRAHEQNQD